MTKTPAAAAAPTAVGVALVDVVGSLEGPPLFPLFLLVCHPAVLEVAPFQPVSVALFWVVAAVLEPTMMVLLPLLAFLPVEQLAAAGRGAVL
jgi:hypothetical protein